MEKTFFGFKKKTSNFYKMAEMIEDLEPLDPTVQNILDQESLRYEI